MFIRKRQSNRAISHQVVETYRDGGKVKQRVLANLGRDSTIEAALENARRLVARGEQALARNETAKGWKAHRRRKKRRQEITNWLAPRKSNLAKLEAVVARMSCQRDTVDTTTRSATVVSEMARQREIVETAPTLNDGLDIPDALRRDFLPKQDEAERQYGAASAHSNR